VVTEDQAIQVQLQVVLVDQAVAVDHGVAVVQEDLMRVAQELQDKEIMVELALIIAEQVQVAALVPQEQLDQEDILDLQVVLDYHRQLQEQQSQEQQEEQQLDK
jgi:hypothetical protein